MSLLKGHTTYTRADKVSSFTVTTAEYGASVPEIYGTTRISGNVIYYDDFTAHEHRETQTAGKGGKSKSVSITYTYTVAVIIGLCEGLISGIGKVWIDKNVYNYPDDTIQLSAYKGTADQSPWAYVVGAHPDKALSYPNLAYMAGVIDLGDSSTMPNYNFEVKGKLLSTGDSIDANPADVVRAILDRIGLSAIEIDGLANYRNYCAEADMLISTPDDADVQSARDTINEIMTVTNAYMFWSNDRFKIVPREDRPVGGWTPNKTVMYDLTPDDLIPQSDGVLISYQRKDPSEIYNRVIVEYVNRDNSYETESVGYNDTDDITEHGLRASSSQKAHWLYTKARAVKLAEQLWRNSYYGRNQYTFKLDWAFCRLEVGDLAMLTDPNSGINSQPAMITSVTEGADGLITFTAVSRPDGEYTVPSYDVHAVDRPYVDYNAAAPDAAVPVILQPPADLTSDGLELWLGTHGTATGWGGCNVWASDDGSTYKQVGQISNSARVGKLINDMSADATTCTVSCSGSLSSGTAQDADRGNTLCWIDGECLSYETAVLQSDGNYALSGLVRGQYTTTAAAHSAGANFARLDESIFEYPLSKEDIGKTVWIKLPSYNIFGAGQQDLANVQAYQYTITAYYIPPVSAVTAYNRYRELTDGVSRYDIVVGWTPPALDSYLQGDVWYKTNHAQASDVTIAEGVASDSIGYAGGWIYAGSGTNQVIIPQAVVGDTYKIAVCTKDQWGAVTSPDLAPSTEILVALKTTIPNTPDGVSITFGAQATVKWSEVTNADVALYELRDDKNPGAETAGLLGRTTGLSIVPTLTSRSGTLYLYAKSAIGKYSSPAVLTYNKSAPKTPDAPQVTAKLGGLSIVAGAIPSDCIGMIAYINDTAVKTVNNTLTYTCDAGIYDVTVSYYDLFGEGAKSASTRVTVSVTVSSDDLADMAVTKAKLDQSVQDAVQAAEDSITAIEGINTDISTLQGTVTGVQTDVNGLTSTVNDQGEDITQIKQTATEMSSTVAALSDTVSDNKTAQDAVNEGVSSDISQIKQTATELSSTVESNKTAQDSINDEVSSDISQIKQAATELSSTVQSNKTAQDTVNSDVSSEISQIKQTATELTSTVQANKSAQDDINAQLQTQIDKSITTWFYAGAPTLANAPASDWTDDATKNVHLGDLYYDTDTGHAYRFLLSDSTYSWQKITDTSVTAALAAAQTAQDTADGKRRVFVDTPVAPYDVGDLWTQGASGDLMRCKTAKASGETYSASDWEKASKYTDDTSLNSFVAGTYATDKASLSSQITQNATSITSVVTKLNGDADADGQYSAIVQLSDGLTLRVKSAEIISQINLSEEGIEINGKLIHITGDTVFDDNVIVGKMIQAGAVTADKMDVTSLSAITGTIGTLRTATSGARTEIKDNLIEVYDANDNLRVKMGVWTE